MNADERQNLHDVAVWLDGHGHIARALSVFAAASELERLGKIEAAAMAWRSSRGTIQEGVAKANLMLATENSPCPKK